MSDESNSTESGEQAAAIGGSDTSQTEPEAQPSDSGDAAPAEDQAPATDPDTATAEDESPGAEAATFGDAERFGGTLAEKPLGRPGPGATRLAPTILESEEPQPAEATQAGALISGEAWRITKPIGEAAQRAARA
jgi:hypothetical protein